jgi:hypothetical protein
MNKFHETVIGAAMPLQEGGFNGMSPASPRSAGKFADVAMTPPPPFMASSTVISLAKAQRRWHRRAKGDVACPAGHLVFSP